MSRLELKWDLNSGVITGCGGALPQKFRLMQESRMNVAFQAPAGSNGY
jgi:hypothetical protein